MARYFCSYCEMPLKSAEYASGICPVCDSPTGAKVNVYFAEDSQRNKARTSKRQTRIVDLSPRWKAVQSGLNLLLIAYRIVLATVIVCMIGAFLLTGFGGVLYPPVREIFDFEVSVLILIPGAMWTCALLLDIVGRFTCCAAPAGSGATGWAVGTLLCLLGSFATRIIALLAAVFVGNDEGLDFILNVTGVLLLIGSLVLFILFIRSTALFFYNKTIARSCVTFLFTAAFFALMIVVIGFNMAMTTRGFGRLNNGFTAPYVILTMVLAAGGLIQFFWYGRLLRKTRDAIRSALAEQKSMAKSGGRTG